MRTWLRTLAILAITLVSCAATAAEAAPHWHAHDANVSGGLADTPETLLASVGSDVHGVAGIMDLTGGLAVADTAGGEPRHARTVVPPTGLNPIAPFQPPRA